MANLVAFNVYQINSSTPVPLASLQKIAFPSQGIMARSVQQNLSTGITVYGSITLIATGAQYLVLETVAAIVTAAG